MFMDSERWSFARLQQLFRGAYGFDEGTDFTVGCLNRFDGEEESRHGGQVCRNISWT